MSQENVEVVQAVLRRALWATVYIVSAVALAFALFVGLVTARTLEQSKSRCQALRGETRLEPQEESA